jgi:hypothetical protein
MTIFRLKQPSSHPRSIGGGVIRWDYDRAELIADGVVHVLGIAFGLIAATGLVILPQCMLRPGNHFRAGLCRWSSGDARTVRDLQPVAGLAGQMGAAPPRSFGDLHSDRRHLRPS